MAKVDENGVVTAVGEGEAGITVTTVLPYLANDTCTVKVAVHHHAAAHPVNLIADTNYEKFSYTPIH